MSTDVIDEVVDEVVDDAELVEEEARAEEKHEQFVEEVDKLLKKGDTQKTEKSTGEKSHQDESTEDEAQQPDALSQAAKDRASDAGISGDLAERLHQQGLLEEMLAAADRKAIQGLEKKQPQDGEKSDHGDGANDESSLDPELFDEQLVKRDRAVQSRIERLESMLEKVLGGFDRQSSSQVQSWVRKSSQSLGELNAAETTELEDGYRRICEAYGVEPAICDDSMLQRAYAAIFPDKVFKKAQRDTVDRLRNAEGKFLGSKGSSGKPPAKKQSLSEEERHEELVAEVDAYLKTGKKRKA